MEARTETGDASPAKKVKREGRGVDMTLKQTAEIGMVLVGMAALRGGAPPTSLERHLAIKAFSNLEGLVECVAPNDLVSKNSLQSLIQQYNSPQNSTLRSVSFPTSAQDVSTPVLVTSAAPASPEAASTSKKQPITASITAIAKPADTLGDFKPPMTSSKDSSNVSVISIEERVEKGPLTLVFKTPKSTLKDSSNLSTIAMGKSVEKEPAAFVSETLMSPLKDSENVSTIAMKEKVEKGPTALVLQTAISSSKVSSNVSITTMEEKVEKEAKARVAEPVERACEVEAVEPLIDQKKLFQKITLEVGLFEPEVVISVLPEMSSAYMNSPITCKICKVLVNDSASVLICDGCETGFHLLCLQTEKILDIPEKDWYCTKCLTANGGRPWQPIYGPLRRGPGRPGSRTTWILKSAPSHHLTKPS